MNNQSLVEAPPPFHELFCANGWNHAPSLARPNPQIQGFAALWRSQTPRFEPTTRGQLAQVIRGESQYASQPPQLKPEQKNPTKVLFAVLLRATDHNSTGTDRSTGRSAVQADTDNHGGIPAQEEIGQGDALARDGPRPQGKDRRRQFAQRRR